MYFSLAESGTRKERPHRREREVAEQPQRDAPRIVKRARRAAEEGEGEGKLVLFVIHRVSRPAAFEPLNDALASAKGLLCARAQIASTRIFQGTKRCAPGERCLPIFQRESADQRFAYPPNIGSSGLRALVANRRTELVPAHSRAHVPYVYRICICISRPRDIETRVTRRARSEGCRRDRTRRKRLQSRGLLERRDVSR